jgi:hypothetical protein
MLGLLIKKNFPGLVTIDGREKVPRHWPNFFKVVDRNVTLADKIKRELWVSLHRTALPILRIHWMSLK